MGGEQDAHLVTTKRVRHYKIIYASMKYELHDIGSKYVTVKVPIELVSVWNGMRHHTTCN